ncbi:nucleotidyl transferase AbiEii/AbiGii toxin family protein [Tenggerimyces flavus]|uniref:Nucleotidyl transferase AbiEii/AbiGii toxin family protein n=1 Tax=Tenggerimyces flavus TaxID=1708749 RepID=A0ABV7Y9B0_9ACTN|nr:nucleotidyl transferase AbiEii/AbiGii toxin family protein [Tenggerimyces flavus]MBM7785672.1 hypothetical protein [Tenggerimyces flavus]
MDPLQERLAEIGLRALGEFGFALAGGQAIQVHGIVDRPSDDIDLFVAWDRKDQFDRAVDVIVDAYRSAGYGVAIEKRYETFARLAVSDGAGSGETSVDLAADWRQHQPVQMAIGPVLHLDDLVASKMSALYGRGEPRDFIDIDAVLRSGRFSREDVLRLAENADAGFVRSMFAQSIARIDRLPTRLFERYGLSAEQVDESRARFAEWRDQLLGD